MQVTERFGLLGDLSRDVSLNGSFFYISSNLVFYVSLIMATKWIKGKSSTQSSSLAVLLLRMLMNSLAVIIADVIEKVAVFRMGSEFCD